MKVTHKDINKIIKQLRDGVRYGAFSVVNDKPICTGTFYMQDNYIRYEHFGASAIGANKKELYWLVNTIYSSEEFLHPCGYNMYSNKWEMR